VSEILRLVLTKFTDETITIFGILSLLTMTGIVIYWFHNRKKFHQLQHEIPASIVKNYLDSIIENSNSLKSSLFRGGGLDIGLGVPAVVPVTTLPASPSIAVGSSSEELNQKIAEIASLKQNVNDRTKQVSEIEARLKEAEQSLGEARKSSGGDAALQKEITKLTTERNELRERLKEYEIIEEDLANLKRLQQENEQLRAELAALKKGGASAPTPPPAAPATIPDVVPESDIDLEAEMAAAIQETKAAPPPPPKPAAVEPPADDVPEVEGEQKSAEELLSEFEKMLG
jgi:DNA repair exonuclease SbcCD ATPase subunit